METQLLIVFHIQKCSLKVLIPLKIKKTTKIETMRVKCNDDYLEYQARICRHPQIAKLHIYPGATFSGIADRLKIALDSAANRSSTELIPLKTKTITPVER